MAVVGDEVTQGPASQSLPVQTHARDCMIDPAWPAGQARVWNSAAGGGGAHVGRVARRPVQRRRRPRAAGRVVLDSRIRVAQFQPLRREVDDHGARTAGADLQRQGGPVQVPERPNSPACCPVTLKLPTSNGAVPGLASTMVRGADVALEQISPKSMYTGSIAAASSHRGAVPCPLSAMACALGNVVAPASVEVVVALRAAGRGLEADHDVAAAACLQDGDALELAAGGAAAGDREMSVRSRHRERGYGRGPHPADTAQGHRLRRAHGTRCLRGEMQRAGRQLGLRGEVGRDVVELERTQQAIEEHHLRDAHLDRRLDHTELCRPSAETG